MQANRSSLGLRMFFAMITVALLAGSSGATEKVLHNFGISGSDGRQPIAALIIDGAGNLYGTTTLGGSEGGGTVFETSPNGSGGWTTKVLHNFGISNNDGQQPYAGLIFDASGNLYGTTAYGGSEGEGTVFEMTPDGSGGWTERVLHNFGLSRDDGQSPHAPLVFDSSGNLYGTTFTGGDTGNGTVFEMTSNGSGGWTERVLHSFGITQNDGLVPDGGLILDGAGNLYGTTANGGSESKGTVFETSANGSGGWTTKVLHNFGIGENDGVAPNSGLIFDTAGNLFSTTGFGGPSMDCYGGCGTVFEMTPNGSGGWTERVIHNFGISNTDGRGPSAGLIFDGAGNLYGTTFNGGSSGQCGQVGCGTVFAMTPNGSGGWTERVLHNFGVSGNDGQYPAAPLIFDGSGNLYGTTKFGGSENDGTVFQSTGIVNWLQYRFVPSHTGYNPYESILSLATVGNLVVDWEYTTADIIEDSSPAVSNGAVYEGSEDGRVPRTFASFANVWEENFDSLKVPLELCPLNEI